MNENMENSENVKITNQPVSGEVLIQKFDENGNKIFEQGGKNAIKSLVAREMKRVWRSAFAAWCSNPVEEVTWDSFNSNGYCRYMFLLKESDAYNSDFLAPVTIGLDTCPVFPLMDRTKSYIGYVDRFNQTVGSDTKIGIINYSESYCTPEKAVFVYDFTSANAVGTFDTIVHSFVSDINNIDDQSWYRRETVLKNGKSFVPTGAYCFYVETIDDKEYQFIVDNPRAGTAGFETQLWLDSTNLETGIINTIKLPNKYEDCQGLVCFKDASKTVFFVKNTNRLSLFVDAGNTGTFLQITPPTGTWSSWNSSGWGGWGMKIDATYVYINNPNDATLKRWNYTTPLVMTMETVVLPTAYQVAFIGDKILHCNSSDYFDLPLVWTGQTLTRKYHKYGYPDMGAAHGKIFGEYYYWVKSYGAYVTGQGGSQIAINKLERCKITDYKQVESVHYKHSVPVTKGSNETMKITYTFNFS